MLNKLIKIDLRFIFRLAPIFFTVALVSAIISLIFSNFEATAINDFIHTFAQNFSLSFAISGIINIITRGIVVFGIKVYGDESYLTHTLPVSKRTIYISKGLAFLYSFLAALGLGILILCINYNIFENFDVLKNFLEATAGITGGNVIEFIILFIIIGFLEITTLASVILMAIILKNRFGKSVKVALAAVGSYLAVQGLGILIIFLVGLGNPEVMKIFTEESAVVFGDAIKVVFYIIAGVYLLATAIITQTNIKLLEKGVNVA